MATGPDGASFALAILVRSGGPERPPKNRIPVPSRHEASGREDAAHRRVQARARVREAVYRALLETPEQPEYVDSSPASRAESVVVAGYPGALAAVRAGERVRAAIARVEPADARQPFLARFGVGLEPEPGAGAARRLAARAKPFEILVDDPTRRALGDRAVVAPRGAERFILLATVPDAGEAGSDASVQPGDRRAADRDAAPQRLDLLTILNWLSAIAALVAWAAVVGAGTMWARFHAAGIPEREAVSVLPRESLVAEGLRTLLLPVLAGAALAGFAALLRSRPEWTTRRLKGAWDWLEGRTWVGVLTLVIVPVGLFLAWLLNGVRPWYAVAIFLVALVGVAALLAVAPMVTRRLPVVAALVFGFGAVWCGVLLTLWEAGAKEPRVEPAVVERRHGLGPVHGLYVGRDADTVFVAESDAADKACGLKMIPASDVRSVLVGPAAARGREVTAEELEKQCLPPRPPPPAGSASSSTDIAGGTDDGPPPVPPPPIAPEPPPPTAPEPPPPTAPEPPPPTAPEPPPPTTPPDAPPTEGAVRLHDGTISIPVEAVRPPDRLVLRKVSFGRAAHPLGGIRATVWVCDTRRRRVRGAIVYAIALPYGHFEPDEDATRLDGRAYLFLWPSTERARRRPTRIVVFARAQRPGDPLLAGVSGRRLVQFAPLRTRPSRRSLVGPRPPCTTLP
jgi:hypothetical protein